MHGAPFAACWHRWDRANKHRASLSEIWNGYIAQHPYDFSLDGQGDGTYIVRVWQETPMPPDFAVIMGEWLYNLRSTLDYVIWATAVHESGQRPPPREEQQLQYPIYDTDKAWRNNLYRLQSLADHHRKMLHTMQPFNSDLNANYLGWINRLARIDRHRRLIDGTACLAVMDPVFQVPHGSTVSLEWGERVLVDGRADVARVTVSPWDESMEISFNPRMGIDPEISEWSESPFWGRMRFSERIHLIQLFVAGEIAVYEYDCTGNSRKSDLLTDDFKVEADARRPLRRITHPPRRPAVWKSGGPGRASTAGRFAGEDFPPGAAEVDEWGRGGDEPEGT